MTEEELIDTKMGRGMGIIDVGWVGYTMGRRERAREEAGKTCR